MAKVIMTSDEFVRRLKVIAARNTYYSNKYPNNLCYIHPDGRTSADCWNLIKALLNGYDVNKNVVGYYQRDLSNTGDVDGATLMKKCSGVSTDFSKLKDGEPRLLYMSGHAGTFIGETFIDGKIYNVIECTGSWERKVLYSYVDTDGTRRHYKGAAKNGKWQKHGKMTPWLDYSSKNQKEEVAPVQPSFEPKKNLDEKALEVYRGKYGNNPGRKQKLKAEGYTDAEIGQIQKKVDELAAGKTTIPKIPKETAIYYTVKAGDTLTAIARRNSTTVLAILKLNQDIKNQNKIYIGQKIRVK